MAVSFPTFYGHHDENARDFMDSLEMAHLMAGRDQEEVKLRAFPLVLKGEARVWYDALAPPSKATWLALYGAFFNKYGQGNTPENLWKQLLQHRQGSSMVQHINKQQVMAQMFATKIAKFSFDFLLKTFVSVTMEGSLFLLLKHWVMFTNGSKWIAPLQESNCTMQVRSSIGLAGMLTHECDEEKIKLDSAKADQGKEVVLLEAHSPYLDRVYSLKLNKAATRIAIYNEKGAKLFGMNLVVDRSLFFDSLLSNKHVNIPWICGNQSLVSQDWKAEELVNEFLGTQPLPTKENQEAGAAARLFGTAAFAFFCFYLLLAVMAGEMQLGLRLVFITIHPMKWGGTLMNSFLFNVGLILLSSISVIQFSATAFALYAQATSVQEIFGHTLESLRGIKYLFKYNVFQIVFVLLSILTLIYYLAFGWRKRKPRGKMQLIS
ncbi:hypothetical protein L7F22_021434 [Adiantum nelumboides]|nr:hypothetical protein [Adiantum nelumboides]